MTYGELELQLRASRHIPPSLFPSLPPNQCTLIGPFSRIPQVGFSREQEDAGLSMALGRTSMKSSRLLFTGRRAMVFPVVMYGCESWTVKKAERWRIDAFELWCWRRLLRVPWTARRSNQSILKEISPGYSLEGLMLKLKL